MCMTRLTWTAPEYVYRHKGPDWYWILGIVTVTAAILSVLLGNILFCFVILLSGFVLALYGARPPRVLKYELSEKGVLVDTTLYPYSTLESYWIDSTVLPSRLLVQSRKVAMPLIVVPIESVRDDEVSDILSEYLHEVEHQESLSQKIFEYFGF